MCSSLIFVDPRMFVTNLNRVHVFWCWVMHVVAVKCCLLGIGHFKLFGVHAAYPKVLIQHEHVVFVSKCCFLFRMS